MWRGEVFAISDCLVLRVLYGSHPITTFYVEILSMKYYFFHFLWDLRILIMAMSNPRVPMYQLRGRGHSHICPLQVFAT